MPAGNDEALRGGDESESPNGAAAKRPANLRRGGRPVNSRRKREAVLA